MMSWISDDMDIHRVLVSMSPLSTVQYYAGKELPKLPNGIVHFKAGSDGYMTVLAACHGKKPVKFMERVEDFPSDELLAKVMLVCG